MDKKKSDQEGIGKHSIVSETSTEDSKNTGSDTHEPMGEVFEQNDTSKNYYMSKRLSTTSFVISMISILVIGLIFLLGLNFYLNKDNHTINLNNWATLTSAPVSFDLNIDSPDDESLVFDKSLLVSGKTSANTPILISSDSSDWAIQSDSSGNFSQTITLIAGLNRLTITAYDSNGNSKVIQRTVYYSENKI